MYGKESTSISLFFNVLLYLSFGSLVLSELQYENIKSSASENIQNSAISNFLTRVLSPEDVPRVSISIKKRLSTTLIKATDDHLNISAGSAVDAAYGLNFYLRNVCNKHISWAGDNMGPLPHPLPSFMKRLKPGVKFRYYQNVCTSSYSYVWWKWERWEREIDWMALNGLNLPLAFTGQEKIWDRIYKSLGCSHADMDEHFTGPAYLAWGRMGNLKKLGGPLSDAWKDSQLALQHRILTRMRSLGMIAVLPAFAGHIPQCITKIFPKANYSALSPWSKFNCTYSCTYLLDPNDPLFTRIGKMFIEEQMREYNETDHVYNCDVFNEMTPRSSDPAYLAGTSRAVYRAMLAADPQAVWMMQGWLFYHAADFWKDEQIKALLTAVPRGSMIILDLFAESYPIYNMTSSFYGQPFIWCMLHNFGGNLGFYGKIDTIMQEPLRALSSEGSTMIGTGITPEGINQNYLVYELMLDIGYLMDDKLDLDEWLSMYVTRRYGVKSEMAEQAWKMFAKTVLDDRARGKPKSKVLIRGPICKRPSMSLVGLPMWYNFSSQVMAWDFFMSALNSELPSSETVEYDAVDVTRQVLVDVHRILYYNLVEEFEHNKSYSLDRIVYFGEMMSALFDDLDRLLSTNQHFRLETWLQDANSLASNQKEADLFELTAKQQLTLWGERGEILDYADKHWSTLMSKYYKPRWMMFVEFLIDAHQKNKDFPHKKFQEKVFNQVERKFVVEPLKPSPTNKESGIAEAQEIYNKWRPLLSNTKGKTTMLFPWHRHQNPLSRHQTVKSFHNDRIL